MKKLLFLCFVTFMLAGPARSQQLPDAFKAKLDKQFSGWHFATIDQAILNYRRQEKIKGRADLISGDFDGDGQTDYAAYIVYQKAGRAFSGVVALLKKKQQISSYILDEQKGGDTAGVSIDLMKKGDKDYNHETKRAFRYRNDAIFVGYFEKGGSSYIYRRGRFIAIVTSD